MEADRRNRFSGPLTPNRGKRRSGCSLSSVRCCWAEVSLSNAVACTFICSCRAAGASRYEHERKDDAAKGNVRSAKLPADTSLENASSASDGVNVIKHIFTPFCSHLRLRAALIKISCMLVYSSDKWKRAPACMLPRLWADSRANAALFQSEAWVSKLIMSSTKKHKLEPFPNRNHKQ